MPVGYVPTPGSVSHLFTGFNGAGTGYAHPMDLSAHPFTGNLTNEEMMAAAEARYGPNFHGTDTTRPRFLALDFESIFGVGSNYMTHLWQSGLFGHPDGDGYPTIEELHDYFAVNPIESSNAWVWSRRGNPPPPPVEPPPPPPPPEDPPPPPEDPPPPPPPVRIRPFIPSISTIPIADAIEVGKEVIVIGPGRRAIFNRAWRNYLRVESHLMWLEDRLAEAYDEIYGRDEE